MRDISSQNISHFEIAVKQLVNHIETSTLTPEQKVELLKLVEKLVETYTYDINAITTSLESAQQKYEDILSTLEEFERMDFAGILIQVQKEIHNLRDKLQAQEKLQEKRFEDMTTQVLSKLVRLEKSIHEPLRDYARLKTFLMSNGKTVLFAVVVYLVLNITLALVGVLR